MWLRSRKWPIASVDCKPYYFLRFRKQSISQFFWIHRLFDPRHGNEINISLDASVDTDRISLLSSDGAQRRDKLAIGFRHSPLAVLIQRYLHAAVSGAGTYGNPP